ncbi:MAG TPA: phosphate ABC transporter substrate-binding protein [Sedimentisphaerales bacterium]|nr:phosphate ABC transporter substrate-binding protein [Sedimentisphaerales bacterium]
MKNWNQGLIECVMAVGVAVSMCGCKGDKGTTGPQKAVISNSGSDTMVNLAQMWAEEYQKVKPEVSVEVAGGGSGVGIRDMMQGIVDIANSSRDMTDSEKEQVKRNAGKEPVEWVVGYDALAVYVHKNNPVESLTLEQLASVYAEGGPADKWSQLNIDIKAAGGNDEIVRVSRQNSSGTYFYFREVVLGNKDYKPGSRDMSGSKDVVELVGKTMGAIGYSGMGYATDAVKFVKLSAGEGKTAYEPSLENVAAGHYPLARSLLMYTLGQPQGAAKEYIEWILSPAGQEIVAKSGYIPVSAGGK